MDKRIFPALLVAATILALTTTPLLNPLTSTTHQTQPNPTARNLTTTPPQTQWNKTYGGTERDIANSVQQTSDGGYILAGCTASFGAGLNDMWLVKTDSSGNQQWSKTCGGTGDDYAYSVQQTADGGYIIGAYTTSFGAGHGDFWLVKTDASGNQQWSKTYGGSDTDLTYSVQQTADGGYIMAGYTDSFGAGGSDFWLVKTDASGNQQWSKTYGGTGDDRAYSVQQTADGGYIMAGSTTSFGPGYGLDFCLVKMDSSGHQQWNKTYGGAGWDEANSVQQTADGGYILAGYTASFGDGLNDMWLVKTDSSGNQQWNKTYGGTGDDYALAVQQTSDNGYIAVGFTKSFGAGLVDFWLVRTDASGNHQWNKTYGGTNDDYAFSVQETSDGGYILAGETYSFGAGSADFWLVKISNATTTTTDGGGLEASIISISAGASVLVLFLLLALAYVRHRRATTEVLAVGTGETASEEETNKVGETPMVVPEPRSRRVRTASSVGPDSCPQCGVRLKVLDASFCWNCGASIEPGIEGVLIRRGGKRTAMAGKCMVCNLDVKTSQEAAWCPYCGNIAHEAHLLEWLHVKDYCPLCSAHLNESDIRKQS